MTSQDQGPTPEDFDWDLGPPLAGDRAVAPSSQTLAGSTIALLVCGGIAAYKAPNLVRHLRKAGADVWVYATPEALRFTTRDALEWTSTHPLITELDGRAQHVEDARQIDVYLVAPATYSTINKLAVGIADNAVTTTLSAALGRLEAGEAQVMVAPTMHGSMANAILRTNLARLAGLGVTVITPRGEHGKANLPAEEVIVEQVGRALDDRE